jgi:hypothetical protein
MLRIFHNPPPFIMRQKRRRHATPTMASLCRRTKHRRSMVRVGMVLLACYPTVTAFQLRSSTPAQQDTSRIPNRTVVQSKKEIPLDTSSPRKQISEDPRSAPPKVPSGARVGSSPSETAEPSSKKSWADRYLWTPGSGIFLGIVVTVLGTFAYDRLKRRIWIRSICRQRRGVVEDIQSLYLHRIEPTERVSPTYVTHCLSKPEACFRSARHFRYLAKRNALPPVMHILLAAKCQGEVVGLLKAIYIHKVRMIFIAYAAVQAGDASLERKAMGRILTHLQRVLDSSSPVEWVSFELTTSDPRTARAKDRLFRQHAQTFGIEIKRVDVEYLQPDLDCVEIEHCKEESASLYLGSTRGTPRHMDLPTLKQLIDSIFLDVYVPTWLIDRVATDEPLLKQYVVGLSDLILDGAPQQVRLV